MPEEEITIRVRYGDESVAVRLTPDMVDSRGYDDRHPVIRALAEARFDARNRHRNNEQRWIHTVERTNPEHIFRMPNLTIPERTPEFEPIRTRHGFNFEQELTRMMYARHDVTQERIFGDWPMVDSQYRATNEKKKKKKKKKKLKPLKIKAEPVAKTVIDGQDIANQTGAWII